MCLCTPHQQTQYIRFATLDRNDRQSVFYHRTGKGAHLCICSCLPPYLPFDSLKLLLLFVTFQTSTLTSVLCGSLHTFRAFIGRCYANIAFSSSVLCRTFLYAFVTKVQCGLPSRLFPTFARCRCRCFSPVSSGGMPQNSISLSSLAFRYPRTLAVCVVCVVLCSFCLTLQRYGNYLEYTIKIHTIFSKYARKT